MAIADVVTMGFGSFSSAYKVVTLGFGEVGVIVHGKGLNITAINTQARYRVTATQTRYTADGNQPRYKVIE